MSRTANSGDVVDAPGRRPVAADDLDVHETDDGLIVYQESKDRVHHLNPTAAVILELCDGTKDTEQIARELAALFGLDEPPLTETKSGIEELTREGLID